MASSSNADTDRLVLGQIGKVHGIKGWLKLNSSTSPQENILEYPQLWAEIDQNWQQIEIDQFRALPKGLLVHIKGYDDPESARHLTGLELSVDAEMLPELEEGEFYQHQLLGLTVLNEQGECFGKVTKVLETGANDVLQVTPDEASLDDRERLIPYLVDNVVKQVDLAKGEIAVSWEADFLE